MSGYVQTNQSVLIPSVAAYTVSAADSGKIMYLSGQAAAQVITLPALQADLHYRFVKTAIQAFASVLTPVAGGNPFQGTIINNATFSAVTAQPTVTFTATAAIGDHVDLYCNGTYWFAWANSKVAAGLSSP